MEGDPRNLLPQTGALLASSFVAGDDNTFEAGIRFNNRFIVGDQGTVFDRSTNLEWIQYPWRIIPGEDGVGQTQDARGDWTESTEWFYGDLVKDVADGNTFWVCILGHTGQGGGAERPAVDSTHWVQTIWVNQSFSLASSAWAMMTWAEAISNSAGLETNGRTDWRLPNIYEMMSLMDYENVGSIYPEFTDIASSQDRWSSTTKPSVTANALVPRFDSADVLALDKLGTNVAHPVRGGLHL